MKRGDQINLTGLAVTILGTVAAVISGLLNPFAASLFVLAICLLSWMAWVTIRLLRPSERDSRASTDVVIPKALPYRTFYPAFEDRVVRVDSEYRKAKIPAVFLGWRRFSLVFWVEITEEFFRTQQTRYLFCYTTNTSSSSGYPNAFLLQLVRNSSRWQLVIKGADPAKQMPPIEFASAQNLLGWKLFCIRWDGTDRKLDFSVDAGQVVSAERTVPEESWPTCDANKQFHLGGWQDGSPGSLSELRYYALRVFDRYLSNADLETALQREGEALKKAAV